MTSSTIGVSVPCRVLRPRVSVSGSGTKIDEEVRRVYILKEAERKGGRIVYDGSSDWKSNVDE